MEAPRRVISLVVPSRAHVPADEPLVGAAGIAFLERLRADAYAFAGIDARTPMDRTRVRAVRMEDAGEDDF